MMQIHDFLYKILHPFSLDNTLCSWLDIKISLLENSGEYKMKPTWTFQTPYFHFIQPVFLTHFNFGQVWLGWTICWLFITFLFCERNYYFAIKKRIFHEKCVKCLPTVRQNLHETEMLKTYGNRTRQLKFYTKNDTVSMGMNALMDQMLMFVF